MFWIKAQNSLTQDFKNEIGEGQRPDRNYYDALALYDALTWKITVQSKLIYLPTYHVSLVTY